MEWTRSLQHQHDALIVRNGCKKYERPWLLLRCTQMSHWAYNLWSCRSPYTHIKPGAHWTMVAAGDLKGCWRTEREFSTGGARTSYRVISGETTALPSWLWCRWTTAAQLRQIAQKLDYMEATLKFLIIRRVNVIQNCTVRLSWINGLVLLKEILFKIFKVRLSWPKKYSSKFGKNAENTKTFSLQYHQN